MTFDAAARRHEFGLGLAVVHEHHVGLAAVPNRERLSIPTATTRASLPVALVKAGSR